MNPIASQPTGSSDAAAALRGASLAFQNKKPPAPTTPAQKRDNGALTAATASSTAVSRSTSPSKRLVPHSTGGSTVTDFGGHGNNASSRLGAGGGASGGSSGYLQARVDSKSPSFIAATLAASRSASPSPMHKAPRRMSSVGGASTASGNETVESTSIAPTGSLISMFERGRHGDPVKRLSPRRNPTDSSEESLPETWRGPVKLPGIAKSPGLPSRAAMASDESLDQRVRTPMKTVPANSQSRPSPLPSTPDSRDQKPSLQHQQLRQTPASPTQKLRPVSGPTLAPAHLSQEDMGAPEPPKPAPSEVEAVTKPKPKPKPQLQPEVQRSRESGFKPKPSVPSKPNGPVKEVPDATSNPPKPKPAPLNPVPRVVSHSTPEVLSPKPTRPTKPALQISHASPVNEQTSSSSDLGPAQKQRPPTPPKPRGAPKKAAPVVTSTRFVKSASDMGTGEAHKPKAMEMVHKPKRSETMSTDDSFVSASSYQSGDRLSPPSLPVRRGSITPSVVSAPISPSRGTPRPYNTSNTNLGLSNLTNAIMAGSLASARLTPQNTGSSLPPPSLPKRQKSPHLRETMRKPTSTEPEEPDRHRSHKHKLSRGKHAHHEGSRKKWRDEVTPRERKRYEAVWASNRGTLFPATVSSSSESITSGGLHREMTELVANVVVREVWRRSRLPEDELAEVWDLVDRDKRGWLGRQEFVIGMWLIDQRLKGRKIPPKVSDSVWGSANGVSVRKPKSK